CRNDECLMSNDEGMTKSEAWKSEARFFWIRKLGLPSSFLIRHSRFDIWHQRIDARPAATRLRQDHTRNFPRCITCSPLNQTSKSRPTQSICVLESHLAPVCSA